MLSAEIQTATFESEYVDNEIALRQALRIYRNAVVAFIRSRLNQHIGANAASQLAALFGKVDPNTGKTEWQRMRENASWARATPEVSTVVQDDFELLGVANFFSVVEKFYDVIFPPTSGEDARERKERKNGVLRCLRQVKAARDPSAHEVTEDIGSDAVALCMANAITILVAFGAEHEAALLRLKLAELVTNKKEYLAACFSVDSPGKEMAALLSSRLKAKSVKCELCNLGEGDQLAATETSRIEKMANAIFAISSDYASSTILKKAIRYAHDLQKTVILVSKEHIAAETLRIVFGNGPLSLVLFHDAYQAEAAERVISKLSSTSIRRAPATAATFSSEISVSEALVDTKFRDQLNASLAMPTWQAIWLVSPFASDVREWRLGRGALSSMLSRQAAEGKKITFITRPPDSTNEVDKARFLTQLEIDQVTVLVNADLHAKIYLFEEEARCRWFLGSHNLTVAGLSRWRDVTLTGYRKPEYQEAKQAMDMIQSHRNTMPFHLWKAQQAKLPKGRA